MSWTIQQWPAMSSDVFHIWLNACCKLPIAIMMHSQKWPTRLCLKLGVHRQRYFLLVNGFLRTFCFIKNYGNYHTILFIANLLVREDFKWFGGLNSLINTWLSKWRLFHIKMKQKKRNSLFICLFFIIGNLEHLKCDKICVFARETNESRECRWVHRYPSTILCALLFRSF